MVFEVGLRVAIKIGLAHCDGPRRKRLLCDRGGERLAIVETKDPWPRDIDREDAKLERGDAHNTPKSFAVRSMHNLALASIFSTSASVMTSGGASTMVSRMARMMRPFSKEWSRQMVPAFLSRGKKRRSARSATSSIAASRP